MCVWKSIFLQNRLAKALGFSLPSAAGCCYLHAGNRGALTSPLSL